MFKPKKNSGTLYMRRPNGALAVVHVFSRGEMIARQDRVKAFGLTILCIFLVTFIFVLPAVQSHGIAWDFPWTKGTGISFTDKFESPVNYLWVSDEYGMREHPVFKVNMMHHGIDLAALKGTKVRSSSRGIVTFAGWKGGYGNAVVIDHGDGFRTVYAHLSRILVQDKQNVVPGELIGEVGATGIATGNHLHFEIRKDGESVNPAVYINLTEFPFSDEITPNK